MKARPPGHARASDSLLFGKGSVFLTRRSRITTHPCRGHAVITEVMLSAAMLMLTEIQCRFSSQR